MLVPKRPFDYLAPIYDLLIRGSTPPALLKLMSLQGTERVLEVGGGTGRTAETVLPHCRELWLLEPSVNMLQVAKRKLPAVKLAYGYAEEMPFEDESFEAIYAVDSIHHWDDQLVGLKEVARVLRDEGQFTLIDFDPRSRAGHFIRSMERTLRMGSRFFTPTEMRKLHEAAGLQVVRQVRVDSGTYATISRPS